MALPEGHNEWEYLQDTIRRWHNKSVANWFKNQPQNDISTNKSGLRHACTIKDKDTANMTLIRLWLFEITAGHAQSLQAPIYGIPVGEFQRDVKYRPQIKLFFREKLGQDSLDRLNPATGEITFRLMGETSQTISRLKAEQFAKDIKRELANPIFVWDKGWYKFTYKDLERGYDLRLLVKSKAEGIRVTKAILAIQNHPYDDDNQQFIDHDRSYSLNPGTHVVYGRSTKKPIKRPRVDVRFRYAQLLIHGQINAINLVAASDVGLKSVIERVNAA